MNLRNRKVLSIILSFALILGIMIVPGKIAFAEDAPKTLTIVHVNDVHGRLKLNDRGKEIGFARLKTKIDELKAADPNVLVLNAGDTFHGDVDVNLSQGEFMVKMMEAVGFDLMVPGNHDFNYGYARLLELKEMAKFPIISANIKKDADGSSDFEAYVIEELPNGLKVGIFALTTEETKFKSHPDNSVGINFGKPVEEAKKAIKALKEQKVDVIIALTHIGNEGTTLTTTKQIAREVEGIDLIVDGHSHEISNELVNGVLIVQAESYTKNIGVVNLEVVDGKVSKKEARLIGYDVAKDLVPDATIEAELKKIDDINAPLKARVVGKSKVELVGERALARTGETNLGNLITDAMLSGVADADLAFANGGGIRASIAEGDVTFGDIITAFPFTNTLAVIEVTGAEIMAALEHGVDLFPAEAGHFPHVSGMTYKFDASKPVGERILEATIKGEPLDTAKTYKLVTNDFMATGGDDYTMFKGKLFVAEGGLLSDVLIAYFEEKGEVNPVLENRIVAINVPEVVEPEPKPEPTPEPKPEPVPEPKPEPTPQPEMKKHVVVRGDTLWRIGINNGTTWQKLAEYNSLKNPHLILPGQIILIN